MSGPLAATWAKTESEAEAALRTARPLVEKLIRGNAEETAWFNFAGDHRKRVFIRQNVRDREIG